MKTFLPEARKKFRLRGNFRLIFWPEYFSMAAQRLHAGQQVKRKGDRKTGRHATGPGKSGSFGARWGCFQRLLSTGLILRAKLGALNQNGTNGGGGGDAHG